MEFHIAREARERYGFSELLFSYTGNVVFANLAASRELAHRVNEVRGAHADPAKAMHAAALFAMGLIDELSHALIAEYRETLDPKVLPEALHWFATKADPAAVERLLRAFTQQFPNVAVYRGEQTVEEWLNATVHAMPNREAAFEELLMLWLENINPAFAPFREFFDDTDLQQKTIYKSVTSTLDDFFATRPEFAPEIGTLLDALRAPMLAAPDSLTGQLAYIREQWTEHLGDELKQVLLAMDVLKEEEVAIWMQFHPQFGPGAAAGRHRAQQQGWGAEGFVGDEFIGFGEEGARERRLRLLGQGPAQEPVVNEYEAFSPDQAWMPTVVLIAKSTYVWLEQLSKKYQRHIHRLDQIPDEELALLAGRGLNGLWLIGLWERSIASQTIKRLRGQADAVASAYSLRDYRIADDLGGEEAYRNLRDRAAAKGIRLASDMVPNHMGIDSTWVMEHPEWFISRPESPFPVYRFEGPDLSNDSRYEIKIEDHYFDQTDAAVVFRLRQRSSGATEFVYHGNDGTTFAWNDTAQLNYLKAEVREQVMQTILSVARLFPIIRFDAAMTLAKKHVQRLWFPLPGVGGSIPSRAESSMTNEEFDALMPNEFWREVVDRVAVEVPGTLLLAEAFWLLEGYFVRTLGMHRVYNSAFMNMLRDEENAKYRSYLKKTIEFDPDILKRYVNFMSNPDERTAIDQFGSGDRYFGVATLLATIPGLPMFGHGQVEGFTEKYGMEYKRARFDEYPNEDLVARHQREIAPLLKNRKLFAESENFVLYDLWTRDGVVNENVFVYSNRLGDERAIIFFNNRYESTGGSIHVSAESMDKGSGSLRSRRLSEALHLPSDDALIIAYKDTVTGLEYLRRSRALDYEGLSVELRGYQYIVLQDWRELRSTADQPWDRLCDALQGGGVYSVDEALSKLRLRPLHQALRQVLSLGCIQTVIELAAVRPAVEEKQALAAEENQKPAAAIPVAVEILPTEMKPGPDTAPAVQEELNPQLRQVVDAVESFLEEVRSLEPAALLPDRTTKQSEDSLGNLLQLPASYERQGAFWPKAAAASTPENAQIQIWSQILAWNLLRDLVQGAPQIVQVFDPLLLRAALAETFRSLGFEGEDAWRAAARVRLLLGHRPERTASSPQMLAGSAEFWSDPDVRWLAGVTEFEGRSFFNKEAFEELLLWLELPDVLRKGLVLAPESTTISDSKKITDSKHLLPAIPAAAEEAGYEVAKLIVLLQQPRAEALEMSDAEMSDPELPEAKLPGAEALLAKAPEARLPEPVAALLSTARAKKERKSKEIKVPGESSRSADPDAYLPE